MKKYLEIAKINLQSSTAFRIETLNWLVISAISTLVSTLLFYNVSKSGSLNNYVPNQIVTYIILSFILERFLYWYFCYWFGGSIKKGRLSAYLLKPYNVIADQIISEISRKLFFTIPYILIAGLLLFLFNGNMYLETINILAFPIIFILAILLSINFTALLSFAAFFTINNHSVINLFFYIVPMIGGRSFPIDILPASMYSILSLLPFPYAFFYPLKILTKETTVEEVFSIIILQVMWIIIFTSINVIIFRKGLKNYDAAGN